jgi:hypothetical protein
VFSADSIFASHVSGNVSLIYLLLDSKIKCLKNKISSYYQNNKNKQEQSHSVNKWRLYNSIDNITDIYLTPYFLLIFLYNDLRVSLNYEKQPHFIGYSLDETPLVSSAGV